MLVPLTWTLLEIVYLWYVQRSNSSSAILCYLQYSLSFCHPNMETVCRFLQDEGVEPLLDSSKSQQLRTSLITHATSYILGELLQIGDRDRYTNLRTFNKEQLSAVVFGVADIAERAFCWPIRDEDKWLLFAELHEIAI
ncbi:hypothetical protein BDV95DRAFT_560327, partial [Massariosphaeria phaeospora]